MSNNVKYIRRYFFLELFIEIVTFQSQGDGSLGEVLAVEADSLSLV